MSVDISMRYGMLPFCQKSARWDIMSGSPLAINAHLVIDPHFAVIEGLCCHAVGASVRLALIYLITRKPLALAEHLGKTVIVFHNPIVSVNHGNIARYLLEELCVHPLPPFGFYHESLASGVSSWIFFMNNGISIGFST
jgi:hypothetical protein